MSQHHNTPFPTPTPLHETFAGEVRGLDLSSPLSAETVEAIREAVDRYGVLVFRGQEALDDDSLAALGSHFGPLFNTNQGFGTNRTVIRLTNLDENGNILPADDRFRAANIANAFWHVDNSFSEPPAKYSMLLARIIPPAGGETEFADARSAYDQLDEETRAKVNGLNAVHSYIYSRSLTGITEWTEEQRRALPDRIRPLAPQSKTTGRRALYLASHIRGIEGWDDGEARAFIAELTEFATQPRFVYRHRWQPGDLLMYDNQVVMHRATPFPDMEHERDMRAIRVMVA